MSVSSSSSGGEAETIIERLNQDTEILEAMLSMPTHLNEEMVESRREEVFAILWEELDMERGWVLSNVRDREEQFIESHSDIEGVPEWLLRMEAQDVIRQMLIEGMDEDSDFDPREC